MALAADFTFNPLTDSLKTADGRAVKLSPPSAPELPMHGFVVGTAGCAAPLPAAKRQAVTVAVSPTSERLSVLEPFPAWNGRDMERLPLLIQVKGQCTTDHISPAGKWLRYRGHLDKISDNVFSAAENVFTGKAGTAVDQLTKQEGPIAQVARHYKAEGLGWVAIGDDNYGEGSSREHAAMSPRYLGCLAVLAKRFARLHETNLKKQGILPLTFAQPADYDAFCADDRLSLTGLSGLAPGQPVAAVVHHADGSTATMTLNHSLTEEQIRWFRAGSALNVIRAQRAN
jgi:aconitate hydratase